MPRLIRITTALLVLLSSASAAGPKAESRFVEIDRIKVHYTNYGAGDSALLFVHGWACDESVWNRQVPAIAETMRSITIDLPGHGASAKPQIAYNMELYARAIDEVLRDAKVSKAVLIGHSNGTPAIRQYYRKFPERVAALVVIDGAMRPFVTAANLEKFLGPMRGAGYAEAAGRFIAMMTKPIADESLREQIKTTMLATPQHVALSEFESTVDPLLWNPDKIEVPVLMILAKQPAWNAEYEQFVRSFVPNLDYQVWENVSHFPMMEKPREFNDALTVFLQKNGLVR